MSSAGFNGTAGSTSAASADVAKMHPLQSAKIDNDKRGKKQYCIQVVEMARPNLFSRAVAAWPEHLTQGDACVAHTKACFCLDDKQKFSNPSFILPAPARQTAERAALPAWISRALPRHSWRLPPRKTIPTDRFAHPVQNGQSLRPARAVPFLSGRQGNMRSAAWRLLTRRDPPRVLAIQCDRDQSLPGFHRAASQLRAIRSPLLPKPSSARLPGLDLVMFRSDAKTGANLHKAPAVSVATEIRQSERLCKSQVQRRAFLIPAAMGLCLR